MASATAQVHNEHAHPTLEAYVKIAILLATVTGIEVAIYYIPAFEDVLVPLLVTLSAFKFVMVVGYFMHLKFDERLLAFLFTSAMIVSLIIFVGLWAIMDFDAPTIFNANMSLLDQKPVRP